MRTRILAVAFAIIAAGFVQGTTGTAGTARSASYEVENASIGSSGTDSAAGAYQVISQVKLSGFSQESQSSTSYQYAPGVTTDADSGVGMWMLY